jgi:hypothetical protein
MYQKHHRRVVHHKGFLLKHLLTPESMAVLIKAKG